MRISHRGASAAVIVALILVGCAARARGPNPGSSKVDIRQTALAVTPNDDAASTWVRYHAFLWSVVSGARHEPWQLEKAVAFFESATGIPTTLIGSWGGLILNYEALEGDLRQWDVWYSLNSSQIDMAKVAAQLPYPEKP
jgi:hypothetical protein